MNTGSGVGGRSASRLWLGAFWAMLVAVMVLSLMPATPETPGTGWDKTNHLLAFAVLTLLGLPAYPRHFWRVLVGLLAYGGLIEVLQSFTPDRLAEWSDVAADALGLASGVAIWWLGRFFNRPGGGSSGSP